MLSSSGLTCLVLSLLLLLQSQAAAGQNQNPHPLLVFCIDAIRYDYLDDLSHLPGFRQLVKDGAKVDYLTPDFPSQSYPNYYSFMTGRYSEVHDMTGNHMWDEDSLVSFKIGTNADSRLPVWWDGSEPLWVTMQRLGKKVYMYYWPGCEVEILGVRPTFCEEYVDIPSEKNFTDAMEHALNVLGSGEAAMAAVYHERIDTEGHHFGPDSAQVTTALRQVDAGLVTLHTKLEEKNLTGRVNIVLFSDHGMTPIHWMEKVIELDKYINMSDLVKMMGRGPVISLWPKENTEQQVYTALSQVPNMTVYRVQDIPQRFHYREGKFVATLTLIAEPGWFIIENQSKLPYWDNGSGKTAWQQGWHGYDNEFIHMRGIFMASGPDFKRALRAAPIRTVDVYNLLCKTLGVEPLPNNGSWASVENLLRDSSGRRRRSLPSSLPDHLPSSSPGRHQQHKTMSACTGLWSAGLTAAILPLLWP